MPKVKRSRKPPPDGWELIEPTLDELDQKMREAETEPHEGKRKVESLWPIFRIHHQKTRYIFDLFYKRKAISRELYEYCIKEGYADKNLIAKWKKQGYENLCCLRCIQTRDTNFGTNCICRVPKSKLEVVWVFVFILQRENQQNEFPLDESSLQHQPARATREETVINLAVLAPYPVKFGRVPCCELQLPDDRFIGRHLVVPHVPQDLREVAALAEL
ncbi:Protein BUD31 [Lamprotornis superbus]|uniref:Protein BUD31 homolog n=1 Tax=Lamprotornis superbus TaxID=245042 RepID=A0A835TTD5_9PASS|nr:Protein BUD31 [Lamprotornis superbus]